MIRKYFILGILSLTLVSCVGSALAAKNKAMNLGDKMPMQNTKMKNVDGKQVSIKDVAGKNGTLVIFSCNACPYVKAWEDRISWIGNTYMAKGVGVIAINANDPERVEEDSYDQMKKRAKAKGFRFPYVVDQTSKVAAAFGANRTPEVFLFDKNNKLVYHGAIDDNSADAKEVDNHYLRNALNALLVGVDIAPQNTKSVGCSIKWRKNAKS